MYNESDFIIVAGEIKDINLYLDDTPHTIEVSIEGGLKNISLIKTETDTFARVETNNTDMQKQTLVIEVHPTGTFLPDANKVTYVGTSSAGYFVWHMFYFISGENDDWLVKRRQFHGEVYTIYKYPVNRKGYTEIEIESSDVRPLIAGIQNEELMLWVLLKIGEDETVTRVSVRCTERDNEADYVLLNTVRLNDDESTKVFYKNDLIVT